jgi:dTDP-4-amino-4,6-dideoxygalactose transaminase
MEVQKLHSDIADKLAIEGGSPVRTAPVPVWPFFNEDTIAAVSAVLRSGQVNYWTGELGRRFEAEFAAYFGSRHAIALANGSVALELALRGIGLQPGDEVITTCRSFMATASSIVLCGGRVVFADVDAETQNITAATIAPLVTPRTRAIIVVHHAGLACDLDPIMDLAAAHGLKVIEDCAQAHGARYKGRSVGSIGHVGCWSFCQDKIMTTGGEGGMLTTDDEDLWRRSWAFKDHGKNHEKVFAVDPKPGYRWLHDSFGSNWRLTEMQAAIGLLQLGKLDDWHTRRVANARVLQDGLAGLAGLHVPLVPADCEHAWYKFYAFVVPAALAPGWDRDRIKSALQAEGIACDSGSCPEMYREEAFAGTGMRPAGRLPVAMDLGLRSLFFQVHTALQPTDMQDVVAAVRKVMAHATA